MPIKYISYSPDPIRGQAILNNINRPKRLLSYRDNNQILQKLDKGLPYYELETLEQVGDDPDNMLIRGECLSACAYLKEQNIEVDLVYIDPPFASGADYAKKVYIRKNPKLAQKIQQAEQTMEFEALKAFEEKMYGDIWTKEDYLSWMYENLTAIKSVMSDTASIYVHLDWHIGHYVKILMDEVFGEDNFVNEIVWSYRSGGASKKTSIARKHDSIYFYTNNSENFKINTIKERQYLDKHFIGTQEDSNGNIYVDTILTDTLTGVINRVMPDGTIKEYNTRPVLNVSKERLEYATQKPEGLIKLLIEISSNENMTVADFFGGSGVTAKVANDLGRKFIHCDVGINSIQTTRDRLLKNKASFSIKEVKDGVSLFRNPQQTMDKLANLIPGLNQNTGLSKFWFGAIIDSKLGNMPVYMPNLLDSKQKVLDIPMLNRIINEELTNLDFEPDKIIVYFVDVDDEKALKKFARNNNKTLTKVELRDLKNLLHAVVLEDEVDFSCQLIKVENKDRDLFNSADHKELYQVEIKRFSSDRLLKKIDEFNDKSTQKKPIKISDEGLELIELIALDCQNKTGIWHSSTEIKIDKLGYMTIDGKPTKDFWQGVISHQEKPLRLKIRNISGDETVCVMKNSE